MKFFSSILIIILLAGCQKFHVINVFKEHGKIIFSNEMVTSTCTKSVYIYDFEVKHINNKVENTAWMLVRNKQANSEDIAFDFPLEYGASIPGVNTTAVAMNLKPGIYKIGATLFCLTINDAKSTSLIGVFAIDSDGALVTDQKVISNMEEEI